MEEHLDPTRTFPGQEKLSAGLEEAIALIRGMYAPKKCMVRVLPVRVSACETRKVFRAFLRARNV